MMTLVGFEATVLPKGKNYLALVDNNATLRFFYGPHANPYRANRSRNNPTMSQAIRELEAKWSDKIGSGEYTVAAVGIVFDVPDGATDQQIINAWISHRTDMPRHSLAAAINQFRAMAPAASTTAVTAPVTAAPSKVKLSNRAAKLLPAAGDVFARPNGEAYLPRELGGNADVLTLRKFRSLDRPIHVLLTGPAGSGKTALAEAAHGEELVTMNCDGDFTVSRMVGQLMPTSDGGWRFAPGPLTIAMENGWALLCDEVNKLPGECISVLYAATDGRGVIRVDDRSDQPLAYAKPGFAVIGTLNPDAAGANGLPEALTSRFSVSVNVTTDFAAARGMGVDSGFVTVAENLASRNAANPGAQQVWVPQMRELLAAKRLMDAGFSREFAADSLLSQCPYPEDWPILQEVMGRVFGAPVAGLSLGPQL